ncbi:ankyrin repeat protein [Colletotrichum chrysophilum]|uniref:Ankyrin repeat protein n=1 Tax=Colletotrichum chrysophilum TaxID=1836956 RepID=A0AAD9APZ8_9PEZI|nr:ankyrin repeat protein [Colletotrichum chrysophilum]
MLNLGDYTISWICALKTEFVAAQAFLDEGHDEPEGIAQGDDNNYALGRMGKHNVVIAILPKGEYGTTSAATVARNMVHSFPNVRIGLMVGIAGGAPSQKHDIRLGDIVVSGRGSGEGGVFQYDYGKTVQNGLFEETGRLNQPPQALLGAVHGLEADYELNGNQLDSKVEEALDRRPRLRRLYSRPNPTTDRLYLPTYTHPSHSKLDCIEVCSDDPASLIVRRARSEDDDNITVHIGLIASGNQVIKDAYVRDRLAAERDVLCFEMEAAGLMNHFPCLIVRGICDYCDTHKNKAWQGSAAMGAAAYTKDLLRRISLTRVEMKTKFAEKLRSIEMNQAHHLHVLNEITADTKGVRFTQHVEAVKTWLTPPDSSTNANRARELRHEGTGKWFLELPVFREWEFGPRRSLWLHGLPGCGKTILVTTAYDYIAREPGRTVLQFSFDFADTGKQTLDNMLRGLIFQLYTRQAQPTGELSDIFKRYNNGRDQPDSKTLSHCLLKMLRERRDSGPAYLFIDALNECSELSKLLAWVERFMAIPDSSHVKLIMTGRVEADSDQRITSLIKASNCVSLETMLVNTDIQSYVHNSLRTRARFRKWLSTPSIVHRISSEVGGRAGGIWAACQLDSLETCIDQEEIEAALRSLPESLNETYERILQKVPEHRRERSILLLQFLVFAPQPFTLEEAVDIMTVHSEGFEAEKRMPDPELILDFCPGMISIAHSTRASYDRSGISLHVPTREVHLAHFSVKEFLLRCHKRFHPVQASICILHTCFTYYWSVKKTAVEHAIEMWSGTARHSRDRKETDIKTKFPLLEFVVLRWMDFVSRAEEPEDIVEKAADILQDSRSFALWRDWQNPLQLRRPAYWEKCGVYYACRKKLPKTMKALILRDTDVDTHNGGIAVLRGASYSGLRDIVQQLLDMMPKSENQRDKYAGALRIAAKEGHYEIVELLLDHGADVHGWQ